MKKNRRASLVALVLLLGLFETGCWFHGPGDVKRELSSAAGVELDREIGLTFGRFSTWIAKQVVKMSDDVDVSLRGVRKVQVGVYQVKGLRPGYENRRPLSMDLFDPEWIPLVRVTEGADEVFVLTKQKEESIRALLVVVAENDEWVIVRIRGRLEHVIEDAMRMAFEEVDHPELYTATRRERGLDDDDRAACSDDAADDWACPAMHEADEDGDH